MLIIKISNLILFVNRKLRLAANYPKYFLAAAVLRKNMTIQPAKVTSKNLPAVRPLKYFHKQPIQIIYSLTEEAFP